MAGSRRSQGRLPLPIRWSYRALADLEVVGDYIAQGSRRAALKWLDRIDKAVGRLSKMPMSGRVVPEFGLETLREVIVGPYRIVYRVFSEEVVVVFVFHSRHQLPGDIDPDAGPLL